jgi:3-oxoadipate enol-lactonase
MPLAALRDAGDGSRRLFYDRRGAGAPLLLIPGMAGHHGLWGEAFLDALAERFEVILFDHRGIGDSDDVAGPVTISALADDALSLLDVLGLERVHVLGTSMGGMVAQELALSAPQRVGGLVLGCTYAGGAGSTLLAPGPLAMLEAMNGGVLETAIRTAYDVNLSQRFRADEGHYAAFREATLTVPVRVPVVLRQAQAALAHDTSTRLPDLRVPTLVVHGTADEMVLYANAEYLAALVPDARLVPRPDVGHLFWWEEPEHTAALIAAHCVAAG